MPDQVDWLVRSPAEASAAVWQRKQLRTRWDERPALLAAFGLSEVELQEWGAYACRKQELPEEVSNGMEASDNSESD